MCENNCKICEETKQQRQQLGLESKKAEAYCIMCDEPLCEEHSIEIGFIYGIDFTCCNACYYKNKLNDEDKEVLNEVVSEVFDLDIDLKNTVDVNGYVQYPQYKEEDINLVQCKETNCYNFDEISYKDLEVSHMINDWDFDFDFGKDFDIHEYILDLVVVLGITFIVCFVWLIATGIAAIFGI